MQWSAASDWRVVGRAGGIISDAWHNVCGRWTVAEDLALNDIVLEHAEFAPSRFPPLCR